MRRNDRYGIAQRLPGNLIDRAIVGASIEKGEQDAAPNYIPDGISELFDTARIDQLGKNALIDRMLDPIQQMLMA